jgi:hypothetical protein
METEYIAGTDPLQDQCERIKASHDDASVVYNLGDKVKHACWGKVCKAKDGVDRVDPETQKITRMGPQREYTIEAFKATRNSKSAFGIGTCPDCGKKISKIVTVIPPAPAVVVEENGDQPKL